MQRIAALLATAAIAFGLCCLAAALWNRSASFLAQTWQSELEQAADPQVDAVLDRLASLEEAAFPVLAGALASDRESVAAGALRVLRGEPSRWNGLPRPEAARRKRSLAKALAASFPEYGPAARRAAASVVTDLLSQPPSGDVPGDAEFLSACTEILRAEADASGPPHQGAAPSATAVAEARVNDGHRSEAAPNPKTEPRPSAAATETPASGSAADNPAEDAKPKAVPLPQKLRRLPPTATAEASDPLKEPPGSPALAAPGDGTAGSRVAASNEPRRVPAVRRTGFDDRAPPSGADGPGESDADQLREKARSLHDPDRRQNESARNALRQRGFSEVELELARQLTDSDPAVRRALARAMVSTTGVDAAPWLLELARDTDADVRLEAMTLLATTADPALLDQLRRLVQADPDERIQRLASRLSRGGLLSERARKGERVRSKGDSP